MIRRILFHFFIAGLLGLCLITITACGCSDDDDDGGAGDDTASDDDTGGGDDTAGDDAADDDSADLPPESWADPVGGIFGDSVTVTLYARDDYAAAPEIYYTTNGQPPEIGAPGTEHGPAPVALPPFTQDTVLQFFAVDNADLREDTNTENYVIDAEAPVTVADPPGGIYNTETAVTLTATDDSGGVTTVFYTTNGTDPVEGGPSTQSGQSPVQVGPLASNMELRFFATDEFGNSEEIKSETYIFDYDAPVTVADPPGGWFGQALTVTLTATDNNTETPWIYYTTDGTDPAPGQGTTQSAAGQATISDLVAETTVRFFAMDDVGNREVTHMELYQFDFTGPICTASPLSGVYNGPYPPLGITPLGVVITCSDTEDPNPTVYYTTDGSDPVPGGETTNFGTSPIGLDVSRTAAVKYFAVDRFQNAGPTVESDYGIYFWDDFEAWPVDQPPGAPWFIVNDSWSCVTPTVKTLDAGGQILQILDRRADCGEGDGFAALKYQPDIPWPAPAGFQFDMRMREGAVAYFGNYAVNGPDEPWRVVIRFNNGVIEAYDQSETPGVGQYVQCATYVLDQWYAFNVIYDHSQEIFTVDIDGAPTPCEKLATYFDGVTGDPIGMKFATDGPDDALVEIDNVRLYQP